MKALIANCSIERKAGHTFYGMDGSVAAVCYPSGATVNLQLEIFSDEDLTELWNCLKPGAVFTDFGIGGATTKETKLTLPSRKLCLD